MRGSLGFAGVVVAAALAPVEVEDVHRSYTLVGGDAVTLTHEMARLGPQHPTGRRAWAYTAWEVSARYELDVRDGACALTAPRVFVRIETTLPEWKPQHEPGGRLRRAWEKLLGRLAEHEAEHRRHALGAAKATAAGLGRLPPMPDCHAVERQARRVLRQSVAAASRESRAFDRETNFGADRLPRLDE